MQVDGTVGTQYRPDERPFVEQMEAACETLQQSDLSETERADAMAQFVEAHTGFWLLPRNADKRTRARQTLGGYDIAGRGPVTLSSHYDSDNLEPAGYAD